LNAVHKALFSTDHRKVDGIEISPAIKTSGQVGFFFGCGMKAPAKGALEPKTAVAVPVLDCKFFNQRVYRNKVPECIKLL
jgi:hypothetical protein